MSQVPKGRLKFIPVRHAAHSAVPSGLMQYGIGLPTLKRWAILGSPFGTQKAPHDFNYFSFVLWGMPFSNSLFTQARGKGFENAPLPDFRRCRLAAVRFCARHRRCSADVRKGYTPDPQGALLRM